MEIFITITIIIIMLVLLVREMFEPIIIFLIVVSVFLLLGYISLDEAISGFSNKGVLTIAVLFILVNALEKSQIFTKMTNFEKVKIDSFNPFSIFGSIVLLSSFMNNTPLVGLFIPIIRKLSKKLNISAQKLLLPVSYLSLFGGILTLIGTSTNLVVSGLMEEFGYKGFGFFEITKISWPVVIISFLYVCFFYKNRLPGREVSTDINLNKQNSHFIRFVVGDESSIIDKTVKNAKLRSLSGVYLLAIERKLERIFPVTPDIVIKKGDRLIFSGETNRIDELKNIDHLILEVDHDFNTNYFNTSSTTLIEAIVLHPFLNGHQTIKELKFRENYKAVVIGIIRNNERLEQKIGNILPRPGDTLLMISNKDDIGILTELENIRIINQEFRNVTRKIGSDYYPIIALAGTILTSIIFDVDLLFGSIFGLIFLLVTNYIQIDDALRKLDYKTLATIALTFGLGKALINSGTANFIANAIVSNTFNLHPIVLLAAAYLIANILTEIITNNAAAVLSVPIVLEMAVINNLDIRPFMIVIAIGASASFLSPYGYQTNLMVYSAGGYKFKDFVRFGYPVTIIFFVFTVLTSYFVFF